MRETFFGHYGTEEGGGRGRKGSAYKTGRKKKRGRGGRKYEMEERKTGFYVVTKNAHFFSFFAAES